MIKSLCLALLLLARLAPAVYSEELYFYEKNGQVLHGALKGTPLNQEINLSSPGGPLTINLNGLIGISGRAELAQMQKILRLGKNIRPSELAEDFWNKLLPFWETAAAQDYWIASFKIRRDGSLQDIQVLQTSSDVSRDQSTLKLLESLSYAPLPETYSEPWLPGYVLINPVLIKQHIFLDAFEKELLSKKENFPNNNCFYRVRLLYTPDGQPITHTILASQQTTSSIKSCSLSENDKLVQFLKDGKHSGISWRQDEFIGLSLWISPGKSGLTALKAAFDPEFVKTSVESDIHNYIYFKMDPALEKQFYKVKRAEKAKINWRSTRYGRYIITFSPKTWPKLKEVVMTTTSGDKVFDNLCLKTLQTIELPRLSSLLNSMEQRTVYKCELWGHD